MAKSAGREAGTIGGHRPPAGGRSCGIGGGIVRSLRLPRGAAHFLSLTTVPFKATPAMMLPAWQSNSLVLV